MTRSLKIVIPGGSGQVGNILARNFHSLGHEVVVLARTRQPVPWMIVPWDGKNLGGWTSHLEGADVVINLAGRSVNCRYTRANRSAIKDSRVLATQVLGHAIAGLRRPPRVWLNASTATIYRHSLDRPMDEDKGEIGGNEPGAPSTWVFSIDVATSWERAFFCAGTPQTRKIALRSAIVMSPDRGGVFDELLRLVRFGLGGTAGSGRQFVSWIHHADFIRSIEYLIAHEEIEGAVNISAPNPLPNREFMQALRVAWGAPFGLPSPAWLLEIGTFFLRTETELVLKSRCVVPGRLRKAGFKFQFEDWPTAVQDLVRGWQNG